MNHQKQEVFAQNCIYNDCAALNHFIQDGYKEGAWSKCCVVKADNPCVYEEV